MVRNQLKSPVLFGQGRVAWSIVLCISFLVAGCRKGSETTLQGHWLGEASDLRRSATFDGDAMAHVSAGSPTPLDDEASAISLGIDFQPHGKFVSELRAGDRQFTPVAGSWRVVQTNGRRWQVELIANDDQRVVRLQLVFADDDHFTATQIDGDDRLGQMRFHR